ncbi:MAG TPA: zinc ribbon domain-containing protein [Pyrinomonadaceae bacterium]|nr:zinc ribbon domain-containing protein [Pyrinomonadaceae bacterium]
MHCPRCGQQQVNEETKFCSKCGFQLHVVSAVLMHGGSLPQLDLLNEQQGKKKLLTRRNGMIFSLFWFIGFLLILCPFFGMLDIDVLTGMSAILGIFGGLILFLASALFLEGKPKAPYYPYPMAPYQMPQYPQQMQQQHPQHPQQMQGQGYQQGALPPQQSQPAQGYTPPPHVVGSWRDTNDLNRGSVTEGTTRLLQKEEE